MKIPDKSKIGNRKSKMCVTLVLACWVVAAVAVRADEVIDRVVAVVAGDIILLSDVRAARELGLVERGDEADPDRDVLTHLIDRALMLAEVDRYAPPYPEEAAVDTAVDEVRARLPTPAAFDRTLARVGLEQTQLRELVRENLRIQSYLGQRFPADTPARQRELVAEWLAGLRRRAEIVDLYVLR
jgi:hypothetical protein